MAEGRYIRIVSLWIHPDQEAAFEAYEGDAARLMARHGGRIGSAVRVEPEGAGDLPFEVHVVSFPDLAAADSYAADPETLKNAVPARGDHCADRGAGGTTSRAVLSGKPSCFSRFGRNCIVAASRLKRVLDGAIGRD